MLKRRSKNLGTIDAHQHLWILSERTYSWITPEYAALYRDFTPEDFLYASQDSKIDGTVLVQSADSYEDTFYMLDVASKNLWVKGVVGWVPFDRTAEAETALNSFSKISNFKGVRNLTHDYGNPKYQSDDSWILREDVMSTLSRVAKLDLSLDYVAVNNRQLESIAQLASKLPNLRIVIDHFGKPNISTGEIKSWCAAIEQCSRQSNLHMKLSGLNTASARGWTSSNWQPYFDKVYQYFGADRIIMGGDWPVITLMDDYAKVWQAQNELLAKLSRSEQEMIRGGNAARFYRL